MRALKSAFADEISSGSSFVVLGCAWAAFDEIVSLVLFLGCWFGHPQLLNAQIALWKSKDAERRLSSEDFFSDETENFQLELGIL
jgi:hypothetical protein